MIFDCLVSCLALSFVAGCAVIAPWISIFVGMCGGLMAILSTIFLDMMKVDDPVGAVSVHGVAGIVVRNHLLI